MMEQPRAGSIARAARALAAVLALAAAAVTSAQAAPAPAGTVLGNAVSASFQSSNGQSYAIHSNEVLVKVQQVGSLVVTPKETSANVATDSFTIGTPYTRLFSIANTGNGDDAYVIAALGSGAGKVQSAKFVLADGSTIPIVIGSTASPAVHPGGTIGVSVTIDSTGIAPNTTFPIKLAAQSSVPGPIVSDSGQVWGIAQAAAHLVNPANPALPIAKLVDGQTSISANPGASVTYSVTVQNAGGGPARNALFDDAVPAGLAPDAASATLNGAAVPATLNGQDLRVAIGDIAGGSTITIAFKATLAPNLAPGTTYVNVAKITADNVSAVQTSPASIVAGVANLVFDGAASGNRPVAGAVVSLLDPATGAPVTLTGPAMPPNTQNANPYTTDATGAYGFGVEPPGSIYGQAKTSASGAQGGASARYVISIVAPLYRNRRIQLDLVQVAGGPLYNVTLTSLDAQPLALPGTFSLTSSNISIGQVFGIFGNLPLFHPGALQVTKLADRSAATAGDRVLFTLDVKNGSGGDMHSVSIVDTLPPGMVYGPHSAQIDGVHAEPAVSGRTLTWNLSSFDAGQDYQIVYAALILPSVQALTTLTNVVDATSDGVSAQARADVIVAPGAFSYNGIITGRVFERSSNAGVPGVLVYL
jgi:uncharacterized repeat protein (TIGR01451 family)